VHLSIFISVFNQLDIQNFCFTISLFHASTCFEHHVRSKLHYTASGIITPISDVEACNKLIIKQKFCTSSSLITDINFIWCLQDRASLSLLKNKNQLDATCYFIVLLIGLICFGHYYVHHQELATMMLITTLVVSFLVCCTLEVSCG